MGGTAQGQVLGGDALYLKDFAVAPGQKPTKVLKMACLMEIFEQCDSAAELLLANRPALEPIVDVSDLLNALTPTVGNETVSYDEYIRRYFTDLSGFRPINEPSPPQEPAGQRPGIAAAIGRFFRSSG